MYSHELQTCDWPRNVGCAGAEAAAAAAAVQVSGQQQQQAPQIRSRPSSASIPISRGSVTAQQQREPQQVAKHDLYTEEELGPAEEIESDRQQRVYRGQPPTIGQVASDRDAIAHSNAIPIQSSGGRDKLSVVSFGAQQQFTRASVAPQVYNEPATAAPSRNYNATQYIAQQYDPYYSLYDEETDLYKDIDYTQYTANQGSQNQQRYRGQSSYKDRKQPTVEIVEEPIQRGAPAYSKTKYNTQQDLYQPAVTQQDYETYSIQTNDDIQYRQPVQTKSSNRLAPIRGTQEILGSKEEKLSALPEGVERNPNHRITLAPRASHQDPTSEPIPFKDDTLNQLLTETTDRPRQTTQLVGSTSTNYISQKFDSDSKQYSDIPLPRAEKLLQQRKQFVIQVTTPVSSTQSDGDSKKSSYDIIKSFLEEQSKTQPAPRPFRPRGESSEEFNTSNRGSSRGRQEDDYSNIRKPISNRGISKSSRDEIPSRISSSRFTNTESTVTQKPFVSRAKTQIVEEYTISSKPLSSRLSIDSDYASKQNLERTRYETIDDVTKRPVSNRIAPEITAIVQEYSPTRRPITSRTTVSDNNIRRKPTTASSRSEISDDRSNRRRVSNRAYSDTRTSNEFNSGISEVSQKFKDDTQFVSRTSLPKAFTKPTTETPSVVSFEKELEKFNNLTPTYATETKATTIVEPKSQTANIVRYSSDSEKKSSSSILSNKQCTSNCTDKQTIRVRPTFESQTTPGITRGTTRHRGSLTYTVSPNEAETPNRGTPATRVRPTLKPSTAIVSKAAEFIDIYKFPPRRPDPVYPTPQVDKTAAKCRKDVCLLPDCYCGGKDVPGELPVEETPQIVLLTFDDSVNDLNKGLYSDLFEQGRTNPNGCPISATFYVSHEWTDYSQVQNLYATGHEIASHSVSHSFGEQFSQKKWTREIGGQREILAAYGGVKQEDIRGMRAPFLAIGGNKMFKMLYDANFTYDSSMPVYENKPPSWPYTMDYKIFHDCMIPPCPTRSYPGVWEVPMVMWQDLKGGRCSMGDACSNPPTSDGVYKMLIKNFERHFTSNRAPFGLFYHAAWFTQPHHKEGFIQFIDTIVKMPEVWLVTNWQAIQWVRDPTPISRLNNFAPFQCNYPERPKKCNNPKVCNLWHKSGVRYMRTCQPCPDVYPWTGKTGVRNSRVDNEVFQE